MTLWTIVIVLALSWLLGMITSYTLSGFIHILLVVAPIVVPIRLIQGRRVIPWDSLGRAEACVAQNSTA